MNNINLKSFNNGLDNTIQFSSPDNFPTENLLLSGRFFGFHLDRDAPQIIGSGIHYNFGKDNFWIISFQKSAINGLNDFRLVSSSFHLERHFAKSVFDIYLGIGSNSYINKSYKQFYQKLQLNEHSKLS